jgi:hypothetical protein
MTETSARRKCLPPLNSDVVCYAKEAASDISAMDVLTGALAMLGRVPSSPWLWRDCMPVSWVPRVENVSRDVEEHETKRRKAKLKPTPPSIWVGRFHKNIWPEKVKAASRVHESTAWALCKLQGIARRGGELFLTPPVPPTLRR